ncbi:MAG TPA: prolipoprotein diacylglyceryl transferase family protein [Pyrinomonadaceae bacterium]|nr:prolipoprotein diacylglyceryl transferase family protein [Pyrinomonadaceae bacterium]
MTEAINTYLDALPRPRLAVLGRNVPTFRTCGIAGFYLALIVLMGGGLLAGRSLIVLAVLALVSALSFFAYAHLRKWITGYEELVLLEQVWFALACNAGALWLMREPLLPYLDVVSVALCFFLAAGRVGCTLVGCCHGHPASVGITYKEACANDGFSRHLIGVRLFPVPAIEGAGLLLIGGSGLIALPFAGAGKVLAWYLIAYSVMRFGLEEMRGDYRPHFLGLSQARWMSIIELGWALGLVRTGQHFGVSLLYYPLAFGLLIVILAIRWHRDWRRQLLTARHWREVRELARAQIETDMFASMTTPAQLFSSQNLFLVISPAQTGRLWSRSAHISMSLPPGRNDLQLLCELASRAFPELIVESAQFGNEMVLHLIAPTPLLAIETSPTSNPKLAARLYGSLARNLQQANQTSTVPDNGDQWFREPTAPPVTTTLFSNNPPAIDDSLAHRSSWYFRSGKNKAG